MNLFTKRTVTGKKANFMVNRGEGGGNLELGIDIYISVCKIDDHQGPTV